MVFGATGIRTAIFRAVPGSLKAAITVGIGLFIAFIGFVNSGFIRTAEGSPLQLGDAGSIASIPTGVFVFALVTIGVLVARKVPGGILIGLVVSTVLAINVQAFVKLGPIREDPQGWHMTIPELPASLFTIPDFGLIGQFDLFASFGRVGALTATMLVFTLVFSNFFDAMGTMTGLAKNAGLAHPDGTFPRLRSAFVVEVGSVALPAFLTIATMPLTYSIANGIGMGFIAWALVQALSRRSRESALVDVDCCGGLHALRRARPRRGADFRWVTRRFVGDERSCRISNMRCERAKVSAAAGL